MSASTDKKPYIMLAGWCVAAFLFIVLLNQINLTGSSLSKNISRVVYTAVNPANYLEKADVENAINEFRGEPVSENAYPELMFSVSVLLFVCLVLPALFLYFSKREKYHGKTGWMLSGTLIILICFEMVPSGMMRVSNYLENKERAEESRLADEVRSEAAIHAYQVAEYMVRVNSQTAPEVINKGNLPVNYEITSWDDSLAVLKASLNSGSGGFIAYRIELRPYENPSVKLRQIRGTGLSLTGID